MAEIKVKYVPIEQIIPYANNARRHGEEDTDAIMASIREFGFNDPIGVWKGIIVEGHGRLIAAKRLGMDKVPVINLDHLTDEQRKAYALAHNKTAELSGWDFDILRSELDEINDINMEEFGFDAGGVEEFNPDERYADEGFREDQEPLSKEELEVYTENADSFLKKKRIIITFLPEQEEDLKTMLGIEGKNVKVLYDITELLP